MNQLNDMSLQEKSREFHERCGKCWHTFSSEGSYQGERICTKCGFKAMDRERNRFGLPEIPDITTVFPSYSDARAVLREMMKREDWDKFAEQSLIISDVSGELEDLVFYYAVPLDLMLDDSGLLLDRALEFMRGRE